MSELVFSELECPYYSYLYRGLSMQNQTITGASSNSKGDTHTASAAKPEASSGVAREFNNFITDIEDLIKSSTNLTGEDLQKAKEKLNQRIAAAKETAAEVGESVVARARQTAETTNTYVHEKPWSAVGASAAIGLLLGYLLARRD